MASARILELQRAARILEPSRKVVLHATSSLTGVQQTRFQNGGPRNSMKLVQYEPTVMAIMHGRIALRTMI